MTCRFITADAIAGLGSLADAWANPLHADEPMAALQRFFGDAA